VALGLQLLDDGTPARAISPCAVDKDDSSLGFAWLHFDLPFFSNCVARRPNISTENSVTGPSQTR
jgi:hypothetical protein